jgi:hypothetical protein
MGTRRHVLHPEEEESYFASMTDVFIGLLFIFMGTSNYSPDWRFERRP